MKTKSEIWAELQSLHAVGGLVYFNAPHTEFTMAAEKRQLDDALGHFEAMGRSKRRVAMSSIRNALERAGPRVQAETATQAEADAFAADCILFLAHELIYADGERLLVAPPERLAGVR